MLHHAYNPIAASGGMEWWTEYIAELILRKQKAQGAGDPERSFHMAMAFIKAGGRHIGETYNGDVVDVDSSGSVLTVTITEEENRSRFDRAMSNSIKHGRTELSGVKGPSVAIVVGGSMRTQHARKELLRGLDLDPIYVEASGLHALSWYGNHSFQPSLRSNRWQVQHCMPCRLGSET